MQVFVSYRRDDVPDAADRLTEDLRERFGHENVFIDIDSIEIGRDFVDVIAGWVGRADAFLAVIGRNWVEARGPDGQRRIEDPGDYVRIEIEAALQQDQLVVPVLIHGATAPPPSQLPESVAPLMRRNAVELTRRYWEEDVRTLMEALERFTRPGSTASPSGVESGDPNLLGAPTASDAERAGPSGTLVTVPVETSRATATPAAITAAPGTVTGADEFKPTIEPTVGPLPGVASRPPTASGPPAAPDRTRGSDASRESASPPTRKSRRRGLVTLGAVGVAVVAVVAVVIAVSSGGGGTGGGGGNNSANGGGATHKPTPPSATTVVNDFFSAYNRGDNGEAAQLWAPAVNKSAVYKPGYPRNAPVQHLDSIAAVQSSVLSHGCQRADYSSTVSGNVVTATYWSFGQRPGQVKCTAGNQHWRDVFTVNGGHITSDISTRIS